MNTLFSLSLLYTHAYVDGCFVIFLKTKGHFGSFTSQHTLLSSTPSIWTHCHSHLTTAPFIHTNHTTLKPFHVSFISLPIPSVLSFSPVNSKHSEAYMKQLQVSKEQKSTIIKSNVRYFSSFQNLSSS